MTPFERKVLTIVSRIPVGRVTTREFHFACEFGGSWSRHDSRCRLRIQRRPQVSLEIAGSTDTRREQLVNWLREKGATSAERAGD